MDAFNESMMDYPYSEYDDVYCEKESDRNSSSNKKRLEKLEGEVIELRNEVESMRLELSSLNGLMTDAISTRTGINTRGKFSKCNSSFDNTYKKSSKFEGFDLR